MCVCELVCLCVYLGDECLDVHALGQVDELLPTINQSIPHSFFDAKHPLQVTLSLTFRLTHYLAQCMTGSQTLGALRKGFHLDLI